MKRTLLTLICAGALSTPAAAATPLFQVDVGGAYSWIDHPANVDAGSESGNVGGISIAVAAGVENRRCAVVGTARLDISGGQGEGQAIYLRQLIGAAFYVKLSPRLRLGAGPAIGFHLSNAWTGNDGGEYMLAADWDVGVTAQLTVDLVKRQFDGSGLYLSTAATYVDSPFSREADPKQAVTVALSIGYRASTRATSVFAAPRW